MNPRTYAFEVVNRYETEKRVILKAMFNLKLDMAFVMEFVGRAKAGYAEKLA